MIVADTGAMLALLDASEAYHPAMKAIYDAHPADWIVLWATLPEIDYLVNKHLGAAAGAAWLSDLAEGLFTVAWGGDGDLAAARRICGRNPSLQLGIVGAVVIAVAERHRAAAIATLDMRHFGAVAIQGHPRLLPRDIRPGEWA